MCGIAAIATNSRQPIPLAEVLQRMTDIQFHRGPDAEGQKILSSGDTQVALGHRRLSIIDLAGGSQPMANEDGTVWITYNGEIYNHLELRSELESQGHRYKTHSDTETIIHAYEQWGPQCVNRLRGMFAFVIWDSRRHRLFAARDRMGIKPFYYAVQGKTFLCASEIKGILASQLQEAKLKRASLPELMTFGYLAGAETLFEGVKTLLPGHWLIWEDGQIRTESYWDVPLPAEEGHSSSEEEFTRQFRELFEESVQMRLMSDVPLGVFLSGGLDSSAIAATMAKQMDDPLMTFSVGFESKYYSEFSYAREVAKAIGANHHEVELRAAEVIASIPMLIWHEDKPIRNASSIALYHVARLAQDHVKVVLTGEGSDELFAGYSRYWATLFNRRWGRRYENSLPRWLREKYIRRTLWKWPLPLGIKKKLSHTFLNHSQRVEEIIFDNFHAIFPQRIHSELFAPEFYRDVCTVDPYRDSVQLYMNRDSGDELDKLLYTDQKTYLLELLMKQDRMSMAASIESRVPFLDHEMVEFASRVPERLKICRGSEKYLVKQAMREMVPESILNRKKMGFPVPIRQWLREGFQTVFRDVLLSERACDRGIFNTTFIEQLLQENNRGTHDHADALWTILNFEMWARVFLDGQAADSVSQDLMGQGEESSGGGSMLAATTSDA
jgi:asparagine synthase (glutamine-hydrolysing)